LVGNTTIDASRDIRSRSDNVRNFTLWDIFILLKSLYLTLQMR
jgi:hypothetical protein